MAGVIYGATAGLLLGCSSGSFRTNAPSIVPAPDVTIAEASGFNSGIRLGSTAQFTASVTNSTDTAVTWQVNGVAGGGSSMGTISPAGLYTPPLAIPSPNSIAISAVTHALPAATSTAAETLWNPLPQITAATASVGSAALTYTVNLIGTGFVAGSQISVDKGTAGPTTFLSPTELQATITLPATTSGAVLAVNNPNSGSSGSAQVALQTVTFAAAARLLDQATFGPTLTDIQHVQQVGLQSYLNEQFATSPTLMAPIPDPQPALCLNTVVPCEQSEWWQAAVTAPDQLRQRVAFALSEMFVISTETEEPRAIIAYQNILLKDSFTNFATIMGDVTLSPGMGLYLNMLDSNKPPSGQIANENYPRELMQLFTVGTDLLNPDGSLQLDANGSPQPTYTEDQVQAFARAYTGWTFANLTGGPAASFPNRTANYNDPMAAVESAHDTTAKTLLLGTTLAAGQTAEQDLADALANIFNHPNVGPFVCRQLIQHLVTSDPSPAYVGRVAAVFADDGQGVRGDMTSVIAAILLDDEARAGDTNPLFDGGHLREPILYITDVVRGLGFKNTDANGYYNTLSYSSGPLGETPYLSPSVFNFFPPEYVIPVSALKAPEFANENTTTALLRLTLANSVVYNKIAGFSVDLSATGPLGKIASTGDPATDSGNLVDVLGAIFMHGEMPVEMRTIIVNHIATLTDIGERVRVATFLVITSSEYKIEH